MNALNPLSEGEQHWVMGDGPDALCHIYNDPITLAVWQRSLSNHITDYVQALLESPQKIALKLAATPSKLAEELQRVFPDAIGLNNQTFTAKAFLRSLNEVIEMFGCLFESDTLGLRINTLEHAMCPRFHVDHVPVRLVTTYGGPGTQWVPAAYADTRQLGINRPAGADASCSIVTRPHAIQQLNAGDVALLKGEKWEGNEGRGLIHRSPSCTQAVTGQVEKRLLITCDLV